jgi:hypothetical protein
MIGPDMNCLKTLPSPPSSLILLPSALCLFHLCEHITTRACSMEALAYSLGKERQPLTRPLATLAILRISFNFVLMLPGEY